MTKKQKLLSTAALAAQTAVPDNSGAVTPAGSNGPAGVNTGTGEEAATVSPPAASENSAGIAGEPEGAIIAALLPQEQVPHAGPAHGAEVDERRFVLAAPARIRGVRRSAGGTVTINEAEFKDLVAVGAISSRPAASPEDGEDEAAEISVGGPFASDDEELAFELVAPARVRGSRRSVGDTVTINRAEWLDLVAAGALTDEDA